MRQLVRGDLLRYTDTVRLDSGGEGSLTVYRLETGTLWQKTCTAQAPCPGSFRPVPADEPRGFWSFLSRYWTSDRRLSSVFARGRGAGDEIPEHALVNVGAADTDLSSAVRKVPPGTYRARLVPVADANAPNAQSDYDFTLIVKEGKSLAGPIQPGLYALSLENAQRATIGASVLVLASASPDVQTLWQTTIDRLSRMNLAPETQQGLRARSLYAIHGLGKNGP